MPGTLSSNPDFSKGGRYAVVVGVNSAPGMAHLSPLKHAEENALAVANVLRECYNCTLSYEPLLGAKATTNAVRDALKTLAQKRTDNDFLIFYFAGYGYIYKDPQEQHQGYLVTPDFDAYLLNEGEDIDSLSLGWLRKRLYETTKAGRVLLLLDCYYISNTGSIPSDLLLNSLVNLFMHYPGATSHSSTHKYRVTIAATGQHAEARQNDGEMTKHLVAILRKEHHRVFKKDGEVTIGTLYDCLCHAMPDQQKPDFLGDHAGRNLVLATSSEHISRTHQVQQQSQRRERLLTLSRASGGNRFLRDRLENFVGREKELRDIEQLIAAVQPSGGYVTITGQAGQGKSSVIAAVIARSATTPEALEYLPFHFIPCNPGPEYYVPLLHNLMARLILKYNLSDLYVACEHRQALHDFFPKVLDEVAAKGGQEIIFIDGLDQIGQELTGIRDLSFLPAHPPEGIVFVLGTRSDDTLQPLALSKSAQSYPLPPLGRKDFSALLARHHVFPLESQVVDQFYERMQQNALYLDLLARELHHQGTITPDAIDALIYPLAKDPHNIFSLVLERLQKHAEDWNEVIKPLLGALLVAYEPLTHWQLQTILNLDPGRIHSGLQYLSDLLTRTEQHYTLFHLQLRDFLRQNEAQPGRSYLFTIDEEGEYHGKLAQWCEGRQLSHIWKDSSDSNEQSRRIYARHHFVSHLYMAQQWEHLFAVLDTQFYDQAREHYYIGTRFYAQDLKKGCLATIWSGWTEEQHIQYLPHLWRYTLLRCSIQSAAERYPQELFKAMLTLGKEREVAECTGALAEVDKKVEVFLLLAQHLFQLPERKHEGEAMYLYAEGIARSSEDTFQQARALATIATALTHTQQWTQAERVTCSIQHSYQQAGALATLASALALAQQEVDATRLFLQAKRVARSIQHSFQQASALATLATALAQAEKIARSIQHPFQQAEALAALVAALAQAQQEEDALRLFSQTARVVRSLDADTLQQTKALAALDIAQAQVQQGVQAESVVHSHGDIFQQVKALATLPASEQRSQLLSLVQSSWLNVKTRNEALDLFPLISGLITYSPSLTTELRAAFQWVNNFWSGS